MKSDGFESKLIAARPVNYKGKEAFTDAVMAGIRAGEPVSSRARGTGRGKRKGVFWTLRHLPRFAVVILAICVLFIAAGTTYAVVETVKKLNVTVDSSGRNEFGREQLQVSFDKCEEEKKQGTTYELKRDSGLSAEDGAKVLQARCEIDALTSWVKNDEQSKRLLNDPYLVPVAMMFFTESVRKIEAISENSIKFERDEAPFPASGRVVVGNQVVGRDALKPGDSIFYFNPSFRVGRGDPATAPAEGVVVFKLELEKRYYEHELQSYVKTRSTCPENPSLTCLEPSNINHVTLIVARGGAWTSGPHNKAMRALQGRVAQYSDASITLDVGGGKLYTIQTPLNVVNKYNTSTVYGLAALDTIYAKTNPEDLKIKSGDMLEINYREEAGSYSQDISWDQLTTISLMVERTVKDIFVLRKY